MEKLNEDYFERFLFKKLVYDSNAMALLCTRLSPKFFKEEHFSKTFEYFQKFYLKNNRLPNKEELKISITDSVFANQLKSAFQDVKDVDIKGVDKDFFMNSAEQFIKRKMTAAAVESIVSNYKSDTIDIDKLITVFNKIASVKLVQNIGFDIYKDVEKYIEDNKEGMSKMPTGWMEIDKWTNGGIPSKGNFIGIVAAPTNTGKSIFLGNLAVNAIKQGKNVLIVSLEMSETVYATRIYSALYNLDIDNINVMSDTLRDCVKNERYGNMIIKEYPTGTLSVEELDGYIETLQKSGYNFDLICVDYMTLLRNTGEVSNSNDVGKELTRKLRAMSWKYKAPVMTAAQVNRSGFQGAPGLENLAESINIAMDSDFAIILHREPEDAEMSIMRCCIKKNRLGKNEINFNLYFNESKLRFEDIDDQSNPSGVETAEQRRESTKALEQDIMQTLDFGALI